MSERKRRSACVSSPLRLLQAQVPLPRRRFLAALGASALLGVPSAWAAAPERRASAAGDSTAPLRFIGVFHPHGCAYEHWRAGAGFELCAPGSTLSPFDDAVRYGRSFKSNLLVIDGLDLAAGIEVGTVGHEAARVILTGSGATGKNASLDQFLAVECLLGAQTPHTSLVLSVGNDSTDLGANISYSSMGTPLPKLIDPERVFDELFGAPLSAQGRKQLQQQRRRGRSVLDWVRADLSQLSQRVPHSERAKLEQHQTALREIEKRLSPEPRGCAPPERPDPSSIPRVRAAGGAAPYLETIAELQIDLLARAISCDLTRFGSLMLADLSRTGQYAELPSDVHAEVAHRYMPKTPLGPGDPASWQSLAIQNRHNHAQVARLLQRLSEAAVLEDTLVYVTSDMGDPARHSSRNVPTLLAGGSGSGFSFGRSIDLRAQKGTNLYAHNRLLVSILQAFGVERESFGYAPSAHYTTGRLSELHDALLTK